MSMSTTDMNLGVIALFRLFYLGERIGSPEYQDTSKILDILSYDINRIPSDSK